MKEHSLKHTETFTGILEISKSRPHTLGLQTDPMSHSGLFVLLQEWEGRRVRITIQDLTQPEDVKPVVVWKESEPNTAKIIWVPKSSSSMGIKDIACSDEGFSWGDYQDLKHRTLK